MSASRSDADEMKELHREAQELRADRQKRRPRAKPASDESASETDTSVSAEPAAPDVAEAPSAIGWEENLEELAGELERAVDQVETTVRNRPLLALLTAFACGVVVGNLTSRR